MWARKSSRLQEKVFTVTIVENEEEREFVVQIKFAREVSFDALQGMYQRQASKELFQAQVAAADIILRTGPTLSFVPVGRSFFNDPGVRTRCSCSTSRPHTDSPHPYTDYQL